MQQHKFDTGSTSSGFICRLLDATAVEVTVGRV
eukprot:CAMPEP_0174987824 /NCGR_PEP_ID=MMETSP0004_2-20121128/19772_1 /TAXON_ID=420556 /ORGANISM="Ochromonas sp., Strain CCMP1393" /LENGTH=32 /DNA_ID= /DNA_START= /DNA_END= /DNA_ORIENTATION=